MRVEHARLPHPGQRAEDGWHDGRCHPPQANHPPRGG